MNDNDVLCHVRESLSTVHMHTPVEAIMAKARARRRRRLSGLAGAATGVALIVGLLAFAASANRPPTADPSTAQVVAFTITSGPNGSSTLILRKGKQYRLDPDALRQALAQRGIPALVTVGRMCDSKPEPKGLDGAISSNREADGSVFTTFDPAAMPAGSKLSIGYFPTVTTFALIQDGAPLRCTTSPPPGSPAGGPGAGHHTQPAPAGQNTSP